MGFYDTHILPHIIQMAMRQEILLPIRKRLAGEAEGRVLEIGVGSGLNLPLYSTRVSSVIGIDPSPELLAMARRAAVGARVPVELRDGSAESIPLDASSVDTVLSTWTLCSIHDVTRALEEARRVLTPGGRLLFGEHGLAPDAGVRRWQHRLTPVWKRFAGGCHLDRDIRALIEGGGFAIESLDVGYLPGPRPMTFIYQGSAVHRQVSHLSTEDSEDTENQRG
jgi:ubiquinone/menaquinone biosynthesis C-methylase UbiE